MKPSAEKMRERLLDTEFKPPLVPEIYTVDVKKHGDPNEIRAALVEQLYKPGALGRDGARDGVAGRRPHRRMRPDASSRA
jgi:hypothetical protein